MFLHRIRLLFHAIPYRGGVLAVPEDAAELGRVGVALGVDHEDLRIEIEVQRRLQVGRDLVRAEGEESAERHRAALAADDQRIAVERAAEDAHAARRDVVRHL